MASVVQTAIAAQVAQVQALTEVTTCKAGMHQFSQAQLPGVMCQTTGGTVLRINNGEYHLIYSQEWAIQAAEADTAQEIAEDIMWLWLQPTQRSALTDLYVVSVILVETDAPIITPISSGLFEVYLKFDFRIAVADPF